MKKYLVLQISNSHKREYTIKEETDNFIKALFVYGKNPSGRLLVKNIDPMELKIYEHIPRK